MEINDIKNKVIQSIKEHIRMEINDDFEKGDNLIERGLSSIMIMKISNKLRKSGIRISFSKLMEKPTFNEWEMLIKSAKINDKFISKEAEIVKNKEYVGIKFPLTDVQYAYWVGREDDQVLGGVGCHAYLEIDGKDINVKKLNEAWIKLQKDHPMLRAKFNSDGTQEIMESPYTDEISVYNLENLDNKEIKDSLNKIREKISHRKLKVEKGEVAGLGIALLPEGKTKIFLDIDLLVADVMSLSIMIKELTRNYVGEGEKHSIDYTFKDYIGDNKDNQLQLEEDKDFWKTKIENDFPMEAPNLPLKIRPEMVKETKFIRRKKVVDEESWSEIKRLASLHKVTPSMVLLACYGLVIERWTNQEKFLINMPLFNRDTENSNLSNMIADFTNLLLVDYERRLGETLIQTIERVSEVFLENVSHSSYSGVQVQRDMYKEIGNNNNVAPIVFACNIDYPLETEKSREALGGISYMISQTPGVWLDFQTYVTDEKLILCWDAVEELYPEELLNDMFDAFYELLISLTKKENWEKKTDVLSQRQKEIRRQEIEAIIPLKYPDERIYDGFIKNVILNPSKVAIIDSSTGEEISYGELYDNALKIAFYLQSEGIKKGDYIGITLPRGCRQIFAIFGILFSGAAYVPIGITQPNERRSKIYDQIGINHIISDEETIISCSLNNEEVKIIDLDKGMNSDKKLESPVQVSPYDSAYIIMTSGTTGVPKGVEIMHTSAINTCIDLNKKYNINTNDTVLMVSSIDFDLSVFDIFGLLHAGGTFITTSEDNYRNPDEWLELIDRYNVTIWDSVPILFDMLVTMAEGKKRKLPFRVVMLSGDWIALNLPGRFYNMSNDSVVVAMGGATEASIWSNYLNVPKEIPNNWVSIPYGKPLENQVYKVVDDFGRTCPNYVKGELLIGGVGVAEGYRGDTELTDNKFIVEDDIRWYRTGDNGRIWNDGTIEFLGRKDTQVKVKGHRIEIGEIEKAIAKYAGVENVIVDLMERGGSKKLVAFIKSDVNSYEVNNMPKNQGFNTSFLVKPKIPSSNDETIYQNKEIDKLVLKTILNVFNELKIDFTSKSYSLNEIYKDINLSSSNRIIVDKWIDTLVNFKLLKKVDGRFKEDSSISKIKIDVESVQEIERFTKEITPELIDILKTGRDPLEVFYREDKKFNLVRLAEAIEDYKESIDSIVNSLNNYIDKNTDRKLRIIEYSTRNSQMTNRLFNKYKDYVEEYVYADNSVFLKEDLSDINENSKFRYSIINQEINDGLEEDYFDVVIALNSIHRSGDSRETLKKLIKKLKPNGLLVGNEINKLNLLSLITADILNPENIGINNDINLKTDISRILYESNVNESSKANFNTFFIEKLKSNKISFEDLKDYLLGIVPNYMIPTYFYHVDEIPLNKNGKADRKKLKKDLLKDVKHSRVISEEITNDISDTEKILLNIWKECLCNENIGVNDNYFIVGGDSLTAASIIGKVKNKMGIEISIKDIFQSASVASLSDFIDKNKMFINRSKIRTLVPDKENIYEPFPLTDVQMAYWIGRQGAYNLGNVSTHCYFEFDSMDINVNKLQKALNDIIEYNPALRTIILNSGEQVILKEVPYYLLNINDLSTLDDDAKENILLQMRESLSHRIIDLSNFPTFDFKVTKITKTLFRIFIGIDNAILDGWSMFEFLKEIKLKYDGDFSSETIEPTFRDYVLYKKQEDRFHYERDKDYWINRLDSFPIMPRLSIMKNDGNNSEQRFKRKEARIKRDDWIEIKRLATEVEVTPTTILLSLFSTILCKYSNSNNFVVNVTQFIKEDIHPEIHKVMGDFTQLCLLEIKLDKSKTILENAKEIQEQLLSDMMHSSYSSIEFLRDLREKKHTDMIAPIIFTSGLGMKGNRNVDFLGELNYSISQTPQVWLDHQVIELDEDLILTWDYVTNLFINEEIDICFNAYVELINDFLESSNKKVDELIRISNDDTEMDLTINHIEKKDLIKKSISNNRNDKNLNSESEESIQTFENEIVRIVENVLKVEKLELVDDFFKSGGNSLNAVQLTNLVNETFNINLSMVVILENPMLQDFSNAVFKEINNRNKNNNNDNEIGFI